MFNECTAQSASKLCPVFAAHFFQHDVKAVKTLLSCVVGIADHLKTKFPQAYSRVDVQGLVEDLKDDMLVLFDTLIVRPLQEVSLQEKRAVLKNARKALVVIDALDECESKKRKLLLRIIQRQWSRVPSWLGLIGKAVINLSYLSKLML